MAGRLAQEKTRAELKGNFAQDVVPANYNGANIPWQQLSVLGHRLVPSFELQTVAMEKPRYRERTYAYAFRIMRTFCFLLIAHARRQARTEGR